jgi:phage shock protein B
MSEVAIVTIVFLSIFGMPVLCFLIIAWVVVRLAGKGKSSRVNQDEMRIVQEVNRGLERMEKRVETLETLLLDRTKE